MAKKNFKLIAINLNRRAIKKNNLGRLGALEFGNQDNYAPLYSKVLNEAAELIKYSLPKQIQFSW